MLSDWKLMLELAGFVLTPVFAAGGAWVSVTLRFAFLTREVALLRSGLRRTELHVANLYGYFRIAVPSDPADPPSPN